MNKQLYKEVIDNLHLQIIHQYESVRRFSKKFKHSEENLCRIFKGNHDMSIGLFLRILIDLELLGEKRPEQTYNLSLKKYLEINHSSVAMGIMNLHTS